MGCLQYYNGASGMVQSFNYMQDIGTPANLEGVNHLANLNYAACVRMESGYCGIRWSQYPSDAVSFTISGDCHHDLIYLTFVHKSVLQGTRAR